VCGSTLRSLVMFRICECVGGSSNRSIVSGLSDVSAVSAATVAEIRVRIYYVRIY